MKTISFRVASKTNKLTKEVKDLYMENYKMKEIEEDKNKWNNILCSWIRKINIVKMPTLPKAIYRFKANPIKNGFFPQK